VVGVKVEVEVIIVVGLAKGAGCDEYSVTMNVTCCHTIKLN
jgi:hypothetical protein